MKKLVFLLVLLSISSFAQQNSKNVAINFPKKAELFQVVNEDRDEFLFFVTNKIGVRAVRFDGKFEVKDSLQYIYPPKSKLDIWGYGVNEERYFTYWKESKEDGIHVNMFDFPKQKTETKVISKGVIEGIEIKSVTINNVFYVITVIKDTNILHFYKFDGFDVKKEIVDITAITFLNIDNIRVSLFQMVNSQIGLDEARSFQTISQETPPSLVFGAKQRKFYVDGSKVHFSFDENLSFSQIITVDLNDFSFKHFPINKPHILKDEFSSESSNSFIFKDKIFLLRSNKTHIKIEIKDFEKNLIKTFEANKEADIPFLNTDIIEENQSIKNSRILGKSKQLLRKIDNLNASLTCFQFNDKICISIGGVSPIIDYNRAIMTGAMSGLAGSGLFISFPISSKYISSNYIANNINSYNNRNVVYAHSLLDQNYNHVKDPLEELPFDKFRNFVAGNMAELSNVFKFKGHLYYGFFNSKLKVYSFYKF